MPDAIEDARSASGGLLQGKRLQWEGLVDTTRNLWSRAFTEYELAQATLARVEDELQQAERKLAMLGDG